MLRKTVTKLERNNTVRNIEQWKWRINGTANSEGSTQAMKGKYTRTNI
jgi:hypothetical protein